MIDVIKYAVLGIIQGLTEFLPVSSSGHLVFFQNVFGFKEAPLFFDILLHLATGIAVIYFLRKELFEIIKNLFNVKSEYFKLGLLLVVASVPTAFMGVLLKDYAQQLFSSAKHAGIALLVTGSVLYVVSKLKINSEAKTITGVKYLDAVIIGIVQGIAIIPGISRSGFTIAAGLSRRLDREFAAKFSFMLSIPAILGALVFEFSDGIKTIGSDFIYMIPGFIAAMLVGFWSLGFLMKIIKGMKLRYFSYYCWIVGIVVILAA